MSERAPAYERVTRRIAEVTGWAPPGERGDWRCPAHDDATPSMSVNRGEKGVVLHCQRGCDVDAILAALGLRLADLFDQPLSRPVPVGEWTPRGPAVAVYDYVDETGSLLFQVLRTAEKEFPCRRPDPSKKRGWNWSMGDTRRVLYRLPKVIDAVAAKEPVFVAEGEKDVHSIEAAGEVATCNPGGGGRGKWRKVDVGPLADADVIVVRDRDPQGVEWAQELVALLDGKAASIRVCEPIPDHKGADVTDHLRAGHTLEQLVLVDIQEPPPDEPPDDDNGDPTAPPPRERLTDNGNALRLVREHEGEIRHVGQWGAWLVWDGKRWQRDHAGAVHELARSTVESLWREAFTTDDGDRRAELRKWALRSEGASRLEAMVRTARTDPRVAVGPDDLDADPWALNVTNGTVDLRTGVLRPHRPADMHTKVAGVAHDAQAEAPTFDRFLEAIVPDPDVRVFLQRAVGYSLTGLTTEQVLFFAHGSGANGKSTLFETLLALLGDYGRHSDPELLLARGETHPTGVADLMGARLVVSSEIEEGRRLAEATVKQLTGGDRIKARYMRQDFFEFTPTHKLFLHANHRPIVRGTDHAIWRRLRLVPFTVTIERSDQDPHLAARLANELPGILNWALQGCRDWIAGGLTEPLAVQAATDDYRAEMDVLGAFMTDRCVQFPHAAASAKALYAAYTDWCDENGERPVSQRRFGMSLTERGFDRRRAGSLQHWHWYGIGLADEPQQQPLTTEAQRLPYRDD